MSVSVALHRVRPANRAAHRFHTFFHQIDSFRSDYFLWVTAGGIGAAHQRLGQRDDDVPQGMGVESDSEAEDPEAGEG